MFMTFLRKLWPNNNNICFHQSFSLLTTFQAAAERRAREREPAENIYNQELTEQEIHHLLTLNDEMQRKILQSRQTGGQEHEFKEGVQIPRGAVQQPENLENIQFTIQPGQHLDFSQENDESI